MTSNKSKQIFIGPKPSSRGAIFFLVITLITAFMFVDTISSPLEAIFIPIPIMYVFVIFLGVTALIGINHRLIYELQDSALIIRQTLETETISYDNIENAQLDKTIRRGITTYLSSRIKSWSPTTKLLSKLTIAGLQVDMNLTGKQVPCISVKLVKSGTWLVIFPENRETEFYNTLLKRLEDNKKGKV